MLGPRFLPTPTTTLTNRLLYCSRFLARPVSCFFFSCLATLGVWPRTLPARASEPWTLPAVCEGGESRSAARRRRGGAQARARRRVSRAAQSRERPLRKAEGDQRETESRRAPMASCCGLTAVHVHVQWWCCWL